MSAPARIIIAQQAVIISYPDTTFTAGEATHWVSDDGMSISTRVSQAEYKLEKELGENNIWLNVRKGAVFHEQEFVEVSVRPPTFFGKYDNVQEGVRALFHTGYGVHIFADRPLSISDDLSINYETDAYETPSGTDSRVNYQPLLQPDNAQVQQCYARVLKTCVKDVLSLNPPPPTEVPAVFYA